VSKRQGNGGMTIRVDTMLSLTFRGPILRKALQHLKVPPVFQEVSEVLLPRFARLSSAFLCVSFLSSHSSGNPLPSPLLRG
jgi:hypothetical protein